MADRLISAATRHASKPDRWRQPPRSPSRRARRRDTEEPGRREVQLGSHKEETGFAGVFVALSSP
jgi:hypothetical protein